MRRQKVSVRVFVALFVMIAAACTGCTKMLGLDDDGLEYSGFVWREEVFPRDYRTIYRHIADGFDQCPGAGVGHTRHLTMDGWADIEVFDRDTFGYQSDTNLGIIRVVQMDPDHTAVKVGVRAGHDRGGHYTNMWLNFADGVYECSLVPVDFLDDLIRSPKRNVPHGPETNPPAEPVEKTAPEAEKESAQVEGGDTNTAPEPVKQEG